MLLVKSYAYLTFYEKEKKPKTRVFAVHNSQKIQVGVVRWHAPWRRYVFIPEPGCIFDGVCLRDITDFVSTTDRDYKRDRYHKVDDHAT